MQARRKEIWNKYQSAFSSLDQCITPVEAANDSRHGYFTYCLRVNKRDELAKYLLQNKIYTTLRYHPLHLNKLYGQEHVSLQNTQELNSKGKVKIVKIFNFLDEDLVLDTDRTDTKDFVIAEL